MSCSGVEVIGVPTGGVNRCGDEGKMENDEKRNNSKMVILR